MRGHPLPAANHPHPPTPSARTPPSPAVRERGDLAILVAPAAILRQADGETFGGRLMAKRSEGRVALVTGGNKGIGREVAARLAALGMTVLVGARSPERGREAAAALGAC